MGIVTYVGLDVHQNSVAAVWGRAKETPQSLTVAANEAGFEQLNRAIGTSEAVWGVYEASSCGFEAYDLLTALGWKMAIVAPTHLEKSVRSRKRKTDLRDAKRLWELLMAHGELGAELPQIWIPSRELQEEREVVRRRLRLGEDSCRVKNRITSLLRMQRIPRPEALKTPWSGKHVAWLWEVAKRESLSRWVRITLESLLRELEFVRKEIEVLDEAISELAKAPKYQGAIERMTQYAGVGVLTAMTYATAIGDADRFHNRGQIGSYFGLVPSSYESGEADDRKGHITRLGSARVRKVLGQAAWLLVNRDARWKQKFKGIEGRRGPKIAIVAIMRELAIELWHQMKSA